MRTHFRYVLQHIFLNLTVINDSLWSSPEAPPSRWLRDDALRTGDGIGDAAYDKKLILFGEGCRDFFHGVVVAGLQCSYRCAEDF